jgi:hypothetical protein
MNDPVEIGVYASEVAQHAVRRFTGALTGSPVSHGPRARAVLAPERVSWSGD